MGRQFEKPRKGSGLTVYQHVFPSASIKRFAAGDGLVSLYDKVRQRSRPAKADDPILCARRVWSQRAESGYMKSIEDAFQDLASQIVTGAVSFIDSEYKVTVDNFFALWRFRVDYKDAPDDEIQFNRVTGEDWSQDQEERFERAGVAYLRTGGRMPARIMHGLRIQFQIDSYVRQLVSVQWGVIRAQAGQFVVPDYPELMIIPISPSLCLSAGGQSGEITRDNLAEVNHNFRERSREYYFAKDLAQCP
jgi:hypothetical protein